ncbi:MFS general substrate transporter [Epithele typhae]|uniref:MFS general substrate transporter n=1 Tax=Epithele typhae TaxID=378194 RepID=UPI00200879BB|nr:MFS general substrate transporter [Epithele typhae]KAH9926269.1 MFS general substrate transporter [Epithele typhae]
MPSEITPLLTEHGVDHEAHKPRKKTPLPALQVGILMLVQIAEPMTSHSIFPYVNQLVSDLNVTGGDERKVGYYVGLIDSIFFVTEALFVFQWARLSDRIGRKPVLLIGLAGAGLSMICFGLSRTLLGLIVSRSLVGLLNGNTGIMKSMMGEITDSTNMAQGFAMHSVSWAVGITIAPFIGGQLARPHDRWPSLFTHPFWRKYAYFLPCLAAASFSGSCCLVAALFLKESLKRPALSPLADDAAPHADADATPPLRTILTRPVVLSIATYGALALADIAFVSLLPLFCATPLALGGLGLGPPAIGTLLCAAGLANGVIQVLVFAPLVDRFGAKRVLQTALAAFVPLFALFPAVAASARAAGGVRAATMALLGAQLVLVCLTNMAYGAVFMYIRSAAPDDRNLGAVNGAAQVVASVSRALGPAAATALFARALERAWLGGCGVYVVLATLSACAVVVSAPLPRNTWIGEPGCQARHPDVDE